MYKLTQEVFFLDRRHKQFELDRVKYLYFKTWNNCEIFLKSLYFVIYLNVIIAYRLFEQD